MLLTHQHRPCGTNLCVLQNLNKSGWIHFSQVGGLSLQFFRFRSSLKNSILLQFPLIWALISSCLSKNVAIAFKGKN